MIPTPQELAELDKHLGALQSIFFYHEDIVAMPKEDREQREAIRSAGQKPQPLTAGVPVAIFVNKRLEKLKLVEELQKQPLLTIFSNKRELR